MRNRSKIRWIVVAIAAPWAFACAEQDVGDAATATGTDSTSSTDKADGPADFGAGSDTTSWSNDPGGGPDTGSAVNPSAEVCGNGFDDNANSQIDEQCPCTAGTTQPCYPGPQGAMGKGPCVAGVQTCAQVGEFASWAAECTGAVLPAADDPCNGIDDNCDGVTDSGCGCTLGEKKPCGLYPNVGPCHDGNYECLAGGLWSTECIGGVGPQQEVGGNGIDDDCNNSIDDPLIVNIEIDIDGDCVTVDCPDEAPYPVGCDVTFHGGDSRGCVANESGSSTVYFQEGNQCGAGRLTGTMQCSSMQGSGLGESNCTINKEDKTYGSSSSDCAETED